MTGEKYTNNSPRVFNSSTQIFFGNPHFGYLITIVFSHEVHCFSQRETTVLKYILIKLNFFSHSDEFDRKMDNEENKN